MEEILTEFQKKLIKKRLNLNFYNENLKSKTQGNRKKFNKNFRQELDVLTHSLYDNGVIFYGFQIEMPFLDKSDPQLWYYVHLHVEGWLSTFRTEVELIEFCYISIEIKNNKTFEQNAEKSLILYKSVFGEGVPFIKGIIGIRSFIGRSSAHFNQVRKVFKIWKGIEFKVEDLNSLKKVKRYWNYVIKENNFKFHRFQYFSNFYEFEYGDIMDLELQYDDDNVAFDLVSNFDSKFSNIKGIQDFLPCNETIINYLITIYMTEEKIFIMNNELYQKTDLQWIKIGSVDFLRENNIQIFEKLKEKFPQHLNGLRIPKLLNKAWTKFFDDIKINNHYLPSIKNIV